MLRDVGHGDDGGALERRSECIGECGFAGATDHGAFVFGDVYAQSTRMKDDSAQDSYYHWTAAFTVCNDRLLG